MVTLTSIWSSISWVEVSLLNREFPWLSSHLFPVSVKTYSYDELGLWTVDHMAAFLGWAGGAGGGAVCHKCPSALSALSIYLQFLLVSRKVNTGTCSPVTVVIGCEHTNYTNRSTSPQSGFHQPTVLVFQQGTGAPSRLS